MSKMYVHSTREIRETLSKKYPQWQQMAHKGYIRGSEMRDIIHSLIEMKIQSLPGGVAKEMSRYCDYFDTLTRREIMTPIREMDRVDTHTCFPYSKQDIRIPLDELPSFEDIRDTVLRTIDIATIIYHVTDRKRYPNCNGYPPDAFLRDFEENGGYVLLDALFDGVPIEDIIVPHRKEIFSTRSFKYRVSEDTNPRFLLYYMIFDTPRNETINAYTLVRELEKYDKYLDEREVEDYLWQLYREGRLNQRSGGYVLA